MRGRPGLPQGGAPGNPRQDPPGGGPGGNARVLRHSQPPRGQNCRRHRQVGGCNCHPLFPFFSVHCNLLGWRLQLLSSFFNLFFFHFNLLGWRLQLQSSFFNLFSFHFNLLGWRLQLLSSFFNLFSFHFNLLGWRLQLLSSFFNRFSVHFNLFVHLKRACKNQTNHQIALNCDWP